MKNIVWRTAFAVMAVTAIGALLLAAGCNKKKETLRITCWAGYAKPYVEDFRKLVRDKYDLEVDVRITNPTDQDEFFQGVRDNTADLISPPIELPHIPRFFCFAEGEQYLQAVDVNNIPNLQNMMAVFREDPTPFYDGRRYGVPYNCGPYGLAYNAAEVKQAPVSWNVLWDSRYAGKYTVNNNFPKVNVWIAALSLGYGYEDIFDIDKLDRAKVQKRLNTLAKNARSLWDGAANPDEFPQLALATTWGFAAQRANLKGGHWRLATPREGGTAWIDCWYIGAGAKGMTKTLAEEWINFMLDPARQADVVTSQGVSPVMADTGDTLTAGEKAMFHVGDEAYFKTVALWRVLSEETEQAFDAMWQTARQHRE